MNTDVPPLTLPDTNSAEYASAESETKIVLSEQPLALPSPCYPGFSQTRILRQNQNDKTQSPTNGDNRNTGALDDGIAITAYNSRAGPLLPSISDAARAQKMLLSLDR